jgi:hypothetical protein
MKASLTALTFGLLLFGSASTARAQGPSLSPIANVSVNAGSALNINVIAVDTEGRVITVSAALPPFATLNNPTVGTGSVATSLTLTPSAAHVGDYSAAVMAEAGGVTNVRVFQITVNAAGSDRAPVVLTPALQEVTAGNNLNFVVTASDADGDAISSLGVSGLPTGASFVPNGANTSGTFDWTPDSGDQGEYDVQFTATNAMSGTSVTHVRVASGPVLAITPIDDVSVAGGGSASVGVNATGVPGAMIVLTAALPTFATLNPPGTGTGSVSTTVTVSPPNGSAGTYHASITATSQGASVTEEFDIIVTGDGGGGNNPPALTAPASATVAIGATLTFTVSATDPDDDHVDIIGSALPPGSNFTDLGNNTGTFTWTPVAGQAGNYTASFSGLDGRGGSGSASTAITVTGDNGKPNQAPVLSAPANEDADEGETLTFTVTATDADGDPVALSANSLPDGATFTDHGNNSGTFFWTPGSDQSGNYTVAFLGSDGKGGTGTASTQIAVVNVDEPPPGGDDVRGRACLIGPFWHNRGENCFRLKPVKNSFDLNDVVLSSIQLRFHGQSIAALEGAAIETHCHGRGDDHHTALGGRDDDDHGHGHGRGGDDDDHGHDRGDDDDHGHGHGDDDDSHGACVGVRCEPMKDHDCNGHGKRWSACDTLGIQACFSTEAIVHLLLGDKKLNPGQTRKEVLCALEEALLVASLKNGATVEATFNDEHASNDDDDDHGHGHGRGKGKGWGIAEGGNPGGWGTGTPVGVLNASATPNPLAPSTQLSFTTVRDGRVRVVVLDMQGRMVKRLQDEFRLAGNHTLAWNGTDERGLRVASGVYFLWIQVPDGSTTRRVTVVQ